MENTERTATDIIARVAPWCAPIPTAYLVGRATIEHLAWPVLIGTVAALVIESLGLATTATALTLWDYNQTKRASDPSAPFPLAAALVTAYTLTAITLTVLLDTAPDLARIAPGAFPLLSLVGVTVLAIRADHRHRLAAIKTDKTQRREARRRAAAERRAQAQQEADQRQRAAELEHTLSTLSTTARHILSRLAADPRQSHAQLAQQVGISRQTAGHHINRLERLGLLSRNGGSIELTIDLPTTQGGQTDE